MPISSITCITPEPDGYYDFSGSSVAINDKYLVTSHFLANRVVIYRCDNHGRWNRSKIVLPPKDSVPDQVGYGFGENVQLDENFLIISASVFQELKYVTNPEDFQETIGTTCYFHERYLVNLDCETEVKSIGLAIEKKPGSVTFNLLSKGEIKKVTLSDRGEQSFGSSFAHYKNKLLVGSPSDWKNTGAWLYDLEQLNCEPEKLALSDAFIGGTVALNEKFAAVGSVGDSNSGHFRIYPKPKLIKPKRTLIKAIENGSTKVLSEIGTLSLSGKILAKTSPSAPSIDHSGLLKVFELDENATPSLIFTQEFVANAFVQNGFLVTVIEDRRQGFKVCIRAFV